MNFQRFDSLFITHANNRVGVNPQGGYVTSWQITREGGTVEDVLYVGSQVKRSGVPILFPHFGRSEVYRMHGFGRDSLWEIVEQVQNRVVMQLSDAMIDEAARLEYPYAFVVRISVEIGADNQLMYGLDITNTGNVPMPILPGLHPYWAIPHGQKKSLKIDGINGFDAGKIDWEQQPPDDIYDFSGTVTVSLPNWTLAIDEVTDGEPKVKNLVVWSQTPVRDPDYDFVCVEPVCGVHYGIEQNPILIEPQQVWSMKLRFGIAFN